MKMSALSGWEFRQGLLDIVLSRILTLWKLPFVFARPSNDWLRSPTLSRAISFASNELAKDENIYKIPPQ
jgi:hypothetical protein